MGLQRVGHDWVTEHTASKQIAQTGQEKHQISSDLEELVPLRTLPTPIYLAWARWPLCEFFLRSIFVSKMVPMNLFAGQQWRCRHGEQTCEHSRGRRGWDEWREQPGNIQYHMENRSAARTAQWYPTLCDPLDCSPPGSSVHGTLQARILQ